MSIKLRTGENLWSTQGTHVCDENGIAVRCEEDTEISFDSQDTEDRVLEIVRDSRTINGLDPDTGLVQVALEPEIPVEPEAPLEEPVI